MEWEEKPEKPGKKPKKASPGRLRKARKCVDVNLVVRQETPCKSAGGGARAGLQ
jgi:hypothetical protein